MPVSIREVAARAGVSLGTVSKVLNEATGAQIAPQTRERVRHAARELGYHPSAVARAMVRKQMDTIGVVLPPGNTSPIRSPFFSALFDGIMQAAVERKQNTTVFTGHTWQDAPYSLPHFRDGRCDGILLFYQLPTSDIIPALLDANVPLVLVNDVRDDPRLSCVDVENIESAQAMTAYLLSLGHRRIAMLCADESLTFVPPRIEGYRRALAAAGIAFDPSLVRDGKTFTEINALLHHLMALPSSERPTAFFAVSDEVARTVISVLTQLGVSVPEQVSVAGFDDDSGLAQVHSTLTTMRQPYTRTGQIAVSLLLEQIQDITVRGKKVILSTELVVRSSTAPPPA